MTMTQKVLITTSIDAGDDIYIYIYIYMYMFIHTYRYG